MEDDLHVLAEVASQKVDPAQAVAVLKGGEADEAALAFPVGLVVAAEEVEAPAAVGFVVHACGLRVLRAVAVDQESDALALPAAGVVVAPQQGAPAGAEFKTLAGEAAQLLRVPVPVGVVVGLVAFAVHQR